MRLFYITVFATCFQAVVSYIFPSLPFYFPVKRSTATGIMKPNRGLGQISGEHMYNEPVVAYRNPMTGMYVVHSDICPHMGAHLHEGWVGENGGLHCPYHGFEFNQDGMFCNIPNPVKQYKRHESRICLPAYPVLEKFGYLFVPGVWPSADMYHPWEEENLIWPKTTLSKDASVRRLPVLDVPYKPFFPPEEFNSQFRVVHGERLIPQYQDIITENLLDMLHISYVHSFGNRLAPIPYEVRGEKIHDWGYKTRFMYSPNQGTISTQIGKVNCVIVENEIYMPSTTITRVIAGNIVKTVHTMTTPRKGQESTLYWRIYRNFWRDPVFPHFDHIGDAVLRFFMEQTIDEDQDILGKIDVERRIGTLYTRYDVTIRKYREMMAQFTLPPT